MIAVMVFIVVNFVYGLQGFRDKSLPAGSVAYVRNIFTIFVAGVLIFIVLLLVFYRMVIDNVSYRTEAEKQLRAAKNAAEDANHSKTQFLSTMGNELRKPLNHVLSISSLLLQTQLTDTQKKYAADIHRGGVSLLSVINDSLDFFKIEAGKLALENNPLIIRDCIEEVRTILLGESRHISINYTIAPEVPDFIVSDIVRLRQILMNLLGNAMRFTDTGMLHLQVDLLEEHAGDLQLQFKIADIGDKTNSQFISVADSEAIFTTHYTGLGLSMAARLVSLMGGAIKIESTSGGSIFTFTIRAGKASDTLPIPVKNSFNADSVDRELSKKIPLRILAADDNEVSQMLLSSMLHKMGYIVDVAQNGTEAVAKAIEENYDLIFMDMFMPEMDGIEATRRIREFYIQNPKPVIIALTANALEEKESFIQAGINNFVTKPYKPKDIENIIIEYCSN